MKLKFLFAGAATALIIGFAAPANAVSYSLSISNITLFGFDDGTGSVDTASFIFTTPSFITSDLNAVPVSGCTISSANWGCSTADFSPGSPNPHGGLEAYIGFVFASTPSSPVSETGVGYLFFQIGALGAFGIYPVLALPPDTPGFGSFADGTLTVAASTTPLPAALPLFASGLGALGLLGWRRKRKAALAA